MVQLSLAARLKATAPHEPEGGGDQLRKPLDYCNPSSKSTTKYQSVIPVMYKTLIINADFYYFWQVFDKAAVPKQT